MSCLVISSGFNFIFSVLAKRLAVKSISGMTYLVSSAKLNYNSVNQCIINSAFVFAACRRTIIIAIAQVLSYKFTVYS